jgi:hypothetical protein
MRKLFLKIFLSFWAMMIITIIITSFVSAEFITTYNENRRDRGLMRMVVSAASMMIESGG